MPLFFTLFFAATSAFFIREIDTSETSNGVELACFLSLASLFFTVVCGVWAFDSWGS